MFYLKWLLGGFLTPIPLMLFAGLIAFVLFMRNRKKLGGFVLLSSLLAFYLLSLRPIASMMLYPLEYEHVVYQNQPVKFIHVLGSGHKEDAALPITSQLGYISTIRVVEAVRIHRLNPTAMLVLTGYAGLGTQVSTAKMHQRLALELGVPQQYIIINEQPRDTEEETLVLKSIVNDHPTAVVTSANHIHRAMAYYNQAGVQAISAPTLHLSRQDDDFSMAGLYPKAEYLRMSQLAVHEWLGIVYQKISTD